MNRPHPHFNGTISDEREVLDACLDRLYVGAGQVVRALTTSGLRGGVDEERMLSYLRENLEGLGEETLADFVVKNRERRPIEPDFDPEGRFTCVGDEEFRRVFRDGDGWERFRRMFPGSDGTLRFSRVGLDRRVTQALIYAGQQFDWNVGSGGYRLFSKTGGSWTELGKVGSWIS
ncbi:hypothetical protein GBA63_12615 [Rubrobacter tropicus]|uniref:Uncharacterized protein n=1 Tax=Rubrobacter tropicus TaxID=2653851 RepID=A0A6G8QA77_9ACTN|nr:hypothetical protein [Rubrobacter tropicus]QIN83385.1 hypothetical protein GBA63_12615 [Rubrobacter tropicus]